MKAGTTQAPIRRRSTARAHTIVCDPVTIHKDGVDGTMPSVRDPDGEAPLPSLTFRSHVLRAAPGPDRPRPRVRAVGAGSDRPSLCCFLPPHLSGAKHCGHDAYQVVRRGDERHLLSVFVVSRYARIV